jgi:hypothetical protein
MSGEPVACSLRPGQLQERGEVFRRVLHGRVSDLTREGSAALRLELNEAPGLREDLERLVDLERACCPFLDFSLVSESGRLVLRIEGPPEAAGVIDDFAGLVRGAC